MHRVGLLLHLLKEDTGKGVVEEAGKKRHQSGRAEPQSKEGTRGRGGGGDPAFHQARQPCQYVAG